MILTQSKLLDLENPMISFDEWWELWVTKTRVRPESKHHQYGNYFEWLVLGKNSGGVTTPPQIQMTSSGKKPIDIRRIEQQAENCVAILESLGFSPKATWLKQYTLKPSTLGVIPEDLGILISGTSDIILTLTTTETPWILDLKLTSNLLSTRTPYSWGVPANTRDPLQLVTYGALFEQEFGIKPKTGWAVFDYSPQLRCNIIELTVSTTKKEETLARYTRGATLLHNYIISHGIQD